MEVRRSLFEYYAHPSHFASEPFEMAPRLWYVGDKMVCSHLVDTGDGLILFDAGYPHTIHLLTESIYALGFDPRDIRLLILSHGHYDHIGAAAEYRSLYGCQVALGAPDVTMFRERPELALGEDCHTSYFDLPEIDRPLSDGDVIEQGDVKILCRACPGHTEGVMSFFFTLGDHRVGYFGGSGFNTIASSYYKKFGLPPDSRREMRDSFVRMKGMPVDVVLGNHPSQNGTFEKRARQLADCPENPFVDPGEWDRRLDALIASFDAAVAKDPV